MYWEMLEKLSQELSFIDYTVLCGNLFLIIFTKPLIKRLGSSSLPESELTLRFNLLRSLNIFILIAYGYQILYRPSDGEGPAIKAITILAVLYITYIVNYFIQAFVQKQYGKMRQIGEQTLYIQTYQSRLYSIIATVILTVVATVGIIRILGFDSLLEAGGMLGILGVLVALTQASWAPDIISGLIILNSDMFEEGDIVEMGDIFGRVHRTKLFHTEIINLRNNHRIMLRNAVMRDKLIHNLSKFATAMGLRECLTFNIGYDVDSDKIKAMLNDAIDTAIEKDLPIERIPDPQIKVLETGDHAVQWGLLFHVKKVEQLINLRRELREIILEKSREVSISLATPTTHFATVQQNKTLSE